MRTYFILFFCTLVFWSFARAEATKNIVMKSLSYDPKSLTIKAGEEVEWHNKSLTDHSATSDDDGGFETGFVHPEKISKKLKFLKPGTFHYHCSVHGKIMHAEIVVTP